MTSSLLISVIGLQADKGGRRRCMTLLTHIGRRFGIFQQAAAVAVLLLDVLRCNSGVTTVGRGGCLLHQVAHADRLEAEPGLVKLSLLRREVEQEAAVAAVATTATPTPTTAAQL